MKESLSIHEARKLVMLSQGLLPVRKSGTATAATLSVIEHLGYVQIDTISVIQRAHHHTLWNRNSRYMNAHLDQLTANKQIFEYWSHAAAFLPMRDFRFSLPRKQALASGIRSHWFDCDKDLTKRVLRRVATEGPLMARDFENTGKDNGEWKLKPAKQALETLFMQGDLMVARRVGFQKVYDLTERVLPTGVDTSVPEEREHARHLITGFLRANGLGKSEEMSYLLQGVKRLINGTLKEMVLAGELLEVKVAGGENYYAFPTALDLLSRSLSRSKLKILSPFDNLVIQRKRLKALFEFDYLIECYVPEKKRRYGYFSLPVLWDGGLVARMDCRADKKERRLHILHLAIESGLRKTDAFCRAFGKELTAFLRFNGCDHLTLHRTTPPRFLAYLQSGLGDLLSD